MNNKHRSSEDILLKLKALKLVFSIIVLLLLPVIGNSIVNESGSFYQFLFGYEPGCAYDNWISHVAEGLVLPGYNDYAPWDRQTPGFGSFVYPDSTQTSQWNTVSNYFVNQQWTSVCEALISYSLPYDLVRFDDTDTGRQYYLLRERLNRNYDDNGTETLADDELGSFDLGWGLFVFNPQATNQIITTVPHPCDDYMSIPIAWKAFTQLNTRYFMISGAGREVMWTNQRTIRTKHLDSTAMRHHDASMRTTVTLDRDVEQMLREAMHRSRNGFKQTLNAAIRAGLGQKTAPEASRPFVVQARPLGLRAGVDPAGFNKMADDLTCSASYLAIGRNDKAYIRRKSTSRRRAKNTTGCVQTKINCSMW